MNISPQNTTSETVRSLPQWRLWLPLILQTALIIIVPAPLVYTHITGKTVVLQTLPVDPYDLMRGYSVNLSYDISRPLNLANLPGWKSSLKSTNDQSFSDYLADHKVVYVTLQAPDDSTSGQPKPWKPVAISQDYPTALKPNQIAIKGHANGFVKYGLETYYMPENRRNEVNANIQQNQLKNPGVVEVKIDAQGNAVPVTLWVGDRAYHF
jgi:uncharacterized membrane-anchored protein